MIYVKVQLVSLITSLWNIPSPNHRIDSLYKSTECPFYTPIPLCVRTCTSILHINTPLPASLNCPRHRRLSKKTFLLSATMRSAYLPIAVSSCVLFIVSGLAAVPHRRDIASHQHHRYHGNGSTIQATHQFPPNTWLENLAVRSNGKCIGTGFLLGCSSTGSPEQA